MVHPVEFISRLFFFPNTFFFFTISLSSCPLHCPKCLIRVDFFLFLFSYFRILVFVQGTYLLLPAKWQSFWSQSCFYGGHCSSSNLLPSWHGFGQDGLGGLPELSPQLVKMNVSVSLTLAVQRPWDSFQFPNPAEESQGSASWSLWGVCSGLHQHQAEGSSLFMKTPDMEFIWQSTVSLYKCFIDSRSLVWGKV